VSNRTVQSNLNQKTRNFLSGSAVSLILALSASGAVAKDASYPFIIGELELELANDNVFRSNDAASAFNSLNPTAAFAAEIGLTPIFSMHLGLTFEQVFDPTDDNYFQDLGLYVDTLHLQANLGDVEIIAGKFAPSFGQAWDVTPGLFGTELVEDYEITEMFGVGFALPLDSGDRGIHTVRANSFLVDTTFLSESMFSNRGRVSRSDGGPANTGKLNNFTATLDGKNMAALPGLSYSLGFAYLSAGEGDLADETGYSLGLLQEFDLDNATKVGINGEIAHFNNAGGSFDDATYYTAGLSLARGPWHGEIAGTIRDTGFDGGGSATAQFIQFSSGYDFGNDLDISAGYAYGDDDGTDSHVFGIRLTKIFGFSSPGAPEEELDLPETPRNRPTDIVIVQ